MKRTIFLASGFIALASSTAFAQAPTPENVGKVDISQTEEARTLAPYIRQFILDHPEVIHESLYNFQQKQARLAMEEKSKMVKTLTKEIYNNPNDPYIGPKDSKKIIVEFFDYNCSACKQMFTQSAAFLAENKDVKYILKEYPIFGEESVQNARIGLAINRLYQTKYKDFHKKMLTSTGRLTTNEALAFASDLGMNVDDIRKEAAKPEILEIIANTRILAEKLKVEGTPTLVINDEVIGHGLDKATLAAKLKGNTDPTE